MAALPAMREEVFAQVFSVESHVIREISAARIVREKDLEEEAAQAGARLVASAKGNAIPHARGVSLIIDRIAASDPCDLDSWEPVYGRLAEAQVKWEAAHGRPLTAAE
jgi:tRNA threonylcarbamoyladenosine biosynthesis protein TsaB